MSIAFSEEKKQKKLLIILAVLVLAIVAIVVYFYFLSPTVSVELPQSSEQIKLESVIKAMSFDLNAFKDSNLELLNISGEWPLIIKDKGRDNPFVSF